MSNLIKLQNATCTLPRSGRKSIRCFPQTSGTMPASGFSASGSCRLMADKSNTHGGARLGAGRHAIENKRVTFNVMIAPETFAAIVE